MILATIKQPQPAFLLPLNAISRGQLLCISTSKALLELTAPDELKAVLLFVHPSTTPLA